MKKIKIITVVSLLFILSLIFIAANRPLRAQNVDKLDQILQQQTDILQKLDLIREELGIIKNRI